MEARTERLYGIQGKWQGKLDNVGIGASSSFYKRQTKRILIIQETVEKSSFIILYQQLVKNISVQSNLIYGSQDRKINPQLKLQSETQRSKRLRIHRVEIKCTLITTKMVLSEIELTIPNPDKLPRMLNRCVHIHSINAIELLDINCHLFGLIQLETIQRQESAWAVQQTLAPHFSYN